jgi:hypothetical protein
MPWPQGGEGDRNSQRDFNETVNRDQPQGYFWRHKHDNLSSYLNQLLQPKAGAVPAADGRPVRKLDSPWSWREVHGGTVLNLLTDAFMQISIYLFEKNGAPTIDRKAIKEHD